MSGSRAESATIVVRIDDPAVELLGALNVARTRRGLRPARLPASAIARVPDPFMQAMVDTAAGVRLRFATRASTVTLRLTAYPLQFTDPTTRFPAFVDLVVDGVLHSSQAVGAGTTRLDRLSGGVERVDGEPEEARFDGLGSQDKVIELWLPHTAVVDLLDVITDRPVRRAPSKRPRWLHHGSSISHCLEATHPTATWPAIAAARLDYDLIDLAFAGNAMLDPFVARTIRDTPADVISLKIGINLVNADVARMRVFEPLVHGFLDTVRDGHPDTPIVVISPIVCPVVEHAPGPTVFDPATGTIASAAAQPFPAGALTLESIRASLTRIIDVRSETDGALFSLDGLTLFGDADARAGLLPDGLHPDERGYALMGERFAAVMPRILDEKIPCRSTPNAS